jgi:hypothetical protein
MDEWQTVSVKGFGPLIDALDRAERKGYMPDAMADEWGNFEFQQGPSNETLTNAYAEGRKDEREEWLPVLEALKAVMKHSRYSGNGVWGSIRMPSEAALTQAFEAIAKVETP